MYVSNLAAMRMPTFDNSPNIVPPDVLYTRVTDDLCRLTIAGMLEDEGVYDTPDMTTMTIDEVRAWWHKQIDIVFDESTHHRSAMASFDEGQNYWLVIVDPAGNECPEHVAIEMFSRIGLFDEPFHKEA